MAKYKAVGYGRVSSADQVSDDGPTIKGSLQAQRQSVEDYCGSHNYDLVAYFEDPGISGEDIEGRPEIQNLMAYVSRHRVNALVVYNGDRLSRNMADYMSIVKHVEWTHKVGIIDLSSQALSFDPENFDPMRDESRLFFHAMRGMFAQADNQQRTRRLKAGKERQILAGRWVHSHAPFGYTFDYKQTGGRLERILVPDPTTYPSLHLIPQIILKEGGGIRQVVKRFVELGIQPVRSDKWQRSVIKGIIDNPFYAGKMVMNRYIVSPGVPRRLPRDKWKLVDHDFPHPWDWETREEMMEVMQSRSPKSASPRTVGAKNPLALILRCPHCNRSLRLKVYQKVYYYFMCEAGREQVNLDAPPCPGVRQPVDPILEAVLLKLDEMVAGSDVEIETTGTDLSLQMIEQSINGVKVELDRIPARRKKINQAYEKDITTDVEYRTQLEDLREEEVQLSDRLNELLHNKERLSDKEARAAKKQSLMEAWQSVRPQFARPFIEWSEDNILFFRRYVGQLFSQIVAQGNFVQKGKRWIIHVDYYLA